MSKIGCYPLTANHDRGALQKVLTIHINSNVAMTVVHLPFHPIESFYYPYSQAQQRLAAQPIETQDFQRPDRFP